jgi:uncharacterized protein YgbK (DUF1537 family)
VLRLLADDLSGALDSAAPFAAGGAPVPVAWDERAIPPGDDLALDSETRDATAGEAAARVAALAPFLSDGAPAFKKIDSCLRGQPAAEIAAVVRGGRFRTTVIAPAHPRQGRITRDGRQLLRCGHGWRPLAVDLPAELAAQGLAVVRRTLPDAAGAFLCDATTPRDLDRVAAAGRALPGPVLWCGSGGLARALAGATPAIAAAAVVRPPALILVGSAHPVTAAQLALLPAPAPDRLRIERLGLPDGTAPAVARAALARLVQGLAAAPGPATLVVAGGETLLRLCRALGTVRLEVEGEVEPGVAVSRMVGGRWPGTAVISKSGGFGDVRCLARLVAPLQADAAHGR